MTDNIVEFVPRETIDLSRQMWQCDCGGVTFKLYANGIVECSGCGTLSNEQVVCWVPPETRW